MTSPAFTALINCRDRQETLWIALAYSGFLFLDRPATYQDAQPLLSASQLEPLTRAGFEMALEVAG